MCRSQTIFSVPFYSCYLGFSNTHTPSPPWIRVVRLLVPMTCCDDAASHLIRVFGDEEGAHRVLGGVKWWQIRGLKGLVSVVVLASEVVLINYRVDAQWIVTKKDWKEAKRRYKLQREKGIGTNPGNETSPEQKTSPEGYSQDMDDMRCILYAHGGLFYFF